jgi:hypothetical protein
LPRFFAVRAIDQFRPLPKAILRLLKSNVALVFVDFVPMTGYLEIMSSGVANLTGLHYKSIFRPAGLSVSDFFHGLRRGLQFLRRLAAKASCVPKTVADRLRRARNRFNS